MRTDVRAAMAAATALLLSAAATAEETHTITVAADGSGQFKTVQEAFDSLPENRTEPTVIRIKPGVYKERLTLGPSHPDITLKGDGPDATDRTVLTFDHSAQTPGPDGKPIGTTRSASVTLEANDFTAEDITFENSAGPGTKVGQAVAVKVSGDRCTFRHCRFLGWQDTLYADGPGHRQYYRDCYIAGTVDFIFGHARAVFEHCELHSRPAHSGAVTAQARTAPTEAGGYVFQNCDLTADKDVPDHSVLLGRPWRPYARVVYRNCRIGPQIDPKGWGNWNDPAREKTAFYAESGCTGPGADRSERVSWSHALTDAEFAEYEPGRFLAGADGWHPEQEK